MADSEKLFSWEVLSDVWSTLQRVHQRMEFSDHIRWSISTRQSPRGMQLMNEGFREGRFSYPYLAAHLHELWRRLPSIFRRTWALRLWEDRIQRRKNEFLELVEQEDLNWKKSSKFEHESKITWSKKRSCAIIDEFGSSRRHPVWNFLRHEITSWCIPVFTIWILEICLFEVFEGIGESELGLVLLFSLQIGAAFHEFTVLREHHGWAEKLFYLLAVLAIDIHGPVPSSLDFWKTKIPTERLRWKLPQKRLRCGVLNRNS